MSRSLSDRALSLYITVRPWTGQLPSWALRNPLRLYPDARGLTLIEVTEEQSELASAYHRFRFERSEDGLRATGGRSGPRCPQVERPGREEKFCDKRIHLSAAGPVHAGEPKRIRWPSRVFPVVSRAPRRHWTRGRSRFGKSTDHVADR